MLFQRGIPALRPGAINQRKPPLVMLDLCAAPGGKSVVLSSLVSADDAILVSNELVSNRARVLEEITAKFVSNCDSE